MNESPKFLHFTETGVKEVDDDVNLKPVVEIWPFCTFAAKYMHYNPYLYANRENCVDSTMGQIPAGKNRTTLALDASEHSLHSI